MGTGQGKGSARMGGKVTKVKILAQRQKRKSLGKESDKFEPVERNTWQEMLNDR